MKALFNTPRRHVPRSHRTTVVITIAIAAITGVSLAFVPQGQAHGQGSASPNQIRPASDRVRDSLFALPVYRREHMQTHPAAYERYQRPGLCYFAMQRAYAFYYRDKRPDTIFATRFDGTAPPIAQEVARACISKFDLKQVPKGQLGPLVPLYLFLNQPRLMDSAYNRILRELPNRDTAEIRLKSSELMRIHHLIGQVRPLPDWSWMSRIPDDLDSLGPHAALFSMRTHGAEPWASAKLDPDAALAELEKVEAAFKKLSQSELMDWGGSVIARYSEWAGFKFWKEGRPEAVTDFAEKRFVPLMGSLSENKVDAVSRFRDISERWSYPYQFYGEPALPIPAKHWFFPDRTDSGKFSWEGYTTLVMFVMPNSGGASYETYSLARLLHQKYGARGFRVLFVASTSGYFRLQLPENSKEEVELIRKYYHEFLKLPVVLAVDEARFNRLPDGRRLPEDIPWQRTCPSRSYDVLVGRDGNIKALLQPRSWGLPRVSAEIEKAL